MDLELSRSCGSRAISELWKLEINKRFLEDGSRVISGSCLAETGSIKRNFRVLEYGVEHVRSGKVKILVDLRSISAESFEDT